MEQHSDHPKPEHPNTYRVAVYYGPGERVDHLVSAPGHTQTLCGRYVSPAQWDTIVYTTPRVWVGRGRCVACAEAYVRAKLVGCEE